MESSPQRRHRRVETAGDGPPGPRRLLPFAAVCLLLSWVPWLVLAALRTDVNSGGAQLAFAFGAAGPSLAALVIWLTRRRDRRGRSGTPVVGWWPVAALLMGVAPPLLTAVLTRGGDLPLLAHHATVVVAGVGGPLGALAYTLISGPLSEEFGWRGYLQPRIRRTYGRTGTALVMAAVWGPWHLPLFFLIGTGQHAMGLLSFQGLLFFVKLFPISYLALFLSERMRGGVWAAILLHGAWNFTDAVMPPLSDTGAAVQTALFAAVAALTALAWRKRDALPAPVGAR